MLSATDPFHELLQIPEARRLLEIARSDNPLIALSVTKREISWTQFQAWLLNPVRHPGPLPSCFAEALVSSAVPGIAAAIERATAAGSPGVRHLATLLSLAPFKAIAIRSAKAEVSEGTKGRADLIIKCDVAGTPLTILVENKVKTKERDDQLQDYVTDHLGTLSEGEVLLPLLIELGDDAVGTSTCPWAVCQGRREADAWLARGADQCIKQGIHVPSLVHSYREVFRSWDLAANLRRSARSLIERIEKNENPPAEWSLVSDLLSMRDLPFFDEVRANPRLNNVLQHHGFQRPELLVAGGNRNDVLQFTKTAWTITGFESGPEGVNVHFESRHRGTMRVDIEIYPYEPGIDRKPDRREVLAQQLEAKTRLHQKLRRRMRLLAAQRPSLGIILKGLRDPANPSTCTAVKFDVGLTEDCTPDQHAAFTADVVEAIAPVVDQILADIAVELRTLRIDHPTRPEPPARPASQHRR